MQYYEKKILTEDEKCTLLENRYIMRISNQRVQYTEEFRALALSEKLCGRTASEILISVGIDPKILGRGRVDSLNANLNTRARACREQDCSDPMLLRKNRELEELRLKVTALEHRLKKVIEENNELFNRAGYYELECLEIKKK